MTYIFTYLLLEVGFAMLAAAFLPRGAALWTAAGLLAVGLGIPAALWVYESQATGDAGGAGMLGTLLFILFFPAGLVLAILASLKSD